VAARLKDKQDTHKTYTHKDKFLYIRTWRMRNNILRYICFLLHTARRSPPASPLYIPSEPYTAFLFYVAFVVVLAVVVIVDVVLCLCRCPLAAAISVP